MQKLSHNNVISRRAGIQILPFYLQSINYKYPTLFKLQLPTSVVINLLYHKDWSSNLAVIISLKVQIEHTCIQL